MEHNRATRMFNDLIQELVLLDLPMTNQSFTWSSMQHNPNLAKLDRFLISTKWDSKSPVSEVEAIPKITPDHYSILLHIGGKLGYTKFRREDIWLKIEAFPGLGEGNEVSRECSYIFHG